MNVVAFDLGSHMACAWSPYLVTSQEFKGNREKRCGDTLIWLHRIFRDLKPMKIDAAVYEQPFARGEHATRSLWGIAGLIEATATNAGLPVISIVPTTIKKWATGDARAEKPAMISAAQVMGYPGNDEHEADAWCLMRYGEAELEKVG